MAHQVNIHEAKTHFSKLVEEVEAGGDVVIARAGKPIMRLVPYQESVERTLDFPADWFSDHDEATWEALKVDFAAVFDLDGGA